MLINFRCGGLLAAAIFRLGVFALFAFSSHTYAKNSFVGTLDEQGSLHATIHIPLDTLLQFLPLDTDTNNAITRTELNAASESIAAQLHARITFQRANQPCLTSILPDWKFSPASNSANNSLVIPMRYQCAALGALTMRADFAKENPLSVVIKSGDSTITRDLSSSEGFVTLDLFENKRAFLSFIGEGFIHILMGYDHILFLITLLLVSVLTPQGKQWQVNVDLGGVVKTALILVTAFTASHSITLGLTIFGWVKPVSHWVELLIAITMLLSAFNNIYPFMHRIALITFLFGLIHGFGFAGALSELAFSKEQQALSLLAFNLGIEFGQLLIVAILLPLLVWLRNFDWYYSYFVRGTSFVIGCIALLLTFARF